MKTPSNTLQITVALLLLTLLIDGIYFLSRDMLSWLSSLDHQLAAILLMVLLASLVIAFGIRRSGYISGVQRFRMEKKAESYSRLIDVWFRVIPRQRSKSLSDKVGVELDVAQRQMMLWATPRVIKSAIEFERLCHKEPLEPALLQSAMEQMVREMRNDLGHSNLGLADGDLVDLAFVGRGDNIQPIARRKQD